VAAPARPTPTIPPPVGSSSPERGDHDVQFCVVGSRWRGWPWECIVALNRRARCLRLRSGSPLARRERAHPQRARDRGHRVGGRADARAGVGQASAGGSGSLQGRPSARAWRIGNVVIRTVIAAERRCRVSRQARKRSSRCHLSFALRADRSGQRGRDQICCNPRASLPSWSHVVGAEGRPARAPNLSLDAPAVPGKPGGAAGRSRAQDLGRACPQVGDRAAALS
jgi:hypothetical protein